MRFPHSLLSLGCFLLLAVPGPISISSAGDASLATDHLTIEVSPGELRGVDAEGVTIWRIQTPAESEPVVTSTADGGLLVDGVVVSRRGAIIAGYNQIDQSPDAFRHDGAFRGDESFGDGGSVEVGGPVGCPYWEDDVVVTPPPGSGADTIAPLIVDSSGNAWMINRRLGSGNELLRVRRFDRAAGVWGPLTTISDTTTYADQPEGTIDGDDNLTIVFRDISSGYRMYAIRHEPGSGWGPLTPIFSTPSFFQALEVASDAEGDVVLINDFRQNQDTTTVRSVFYDAVSGTWGSPVQVSPDGYDTMLPTLAQNKAGTSLYLVYRVTGGGPVGLYGHRWDGAANAWGPAEYIPDSQTPGFSSVGASSRFPLTVGGDGEATLLWRTRSPYTVYTSRTQDGTWQAPHEVLPPGSWSTNIENFAYIDSNADGDVMGAIMRWEGFDANHFYTFRYDHATGWRDVEIPYTSSLNLVTRVRVVFYSGARAAGTVLGSQDGQRQLVSLNYDGLDWHPDLLDIPQDHDGYFQSIIADRTETLLVYQAEHGATDFGNLATWLKNTVGDLDCNGIVDINDFENYLDCVTGPGVPTGVECRDADLDGDGDADIADVAIMQRVFSQ